MNTSIAFQKVKYLYNAVPLIITVHFVSTILFALIMWQDVEGKALLVWTAIMTIVLLFRIYHFFLYNNSSDDEIAHETTLWQHRYYTYILINGAMWGSTAVLFFPSVGLLYQMVILLFILGSTATALGIISASWYLVLAYSILSYAPIILKLFWMNDALYQTLGYIVAALSILMIFTAKHFNKIIEIALHSQYDVSVSRENLIFSQNDFFRFLYDVPVGIFTFDRDLKITHINARMLKLLNRKDAESLIGFDLHEIGDKRILPPLVETINEHPGSYEGFFFSVFADQQLYIDMKTDTIIDHKEHIIGGVCYVTDKTSEHEAMETIQQNAFYDPLTKLPNRILFADRLELAVEQSRRQGHLCAVLFLDLDRFKYINDSYGHFIGDQILYRVSQRLLERVRAEDTVARVGGDEFLILLHGLPRDEEAARHLAKQIAEDLISTVDIAFEVDTHAIAITASVGIYLFSGDSINDAATIIKMADIAMNQAKRTGRNHAEFYQEYFAMLQERFLQQENDLRDAIERHEFVLYYQPKVNLKTGRIEQVEALIRWNHPEKGLILPDQFIYVAESSGLIIQIGDWVIDQSLRQYSAWQDNGNAEQIKNIAINVSSHQFNQPDFVDNIFKRLEHYGIEGSAISLELTESAMLEHQHDAVQKVKQLESHGIHIALDDFGTGYNSLSHLKHLPVSVIKIDRSFISDLKHNQNSQMIVKTIISIAKSMNLIVVAEGVESPEELELLKELECDYYQGFYCEEALPAPVLEQLVRNGKADSEEC